MVYIELLFIVILVPFALFIQPRRHRVYVDVTVLRRRFFRFRFRKRTFSFPRISVKPVLKVLMWILGLSVVGAATLTLSRFLPTWIRQVQEEAARNTLLMTNEAQCREAAKFWQANLPSNEALIMTNHARDESGCNQKYPDGRVYHYVARLGHKLSTARGVMMVPAELDAQAKEQGFNLDEWNDNLKFSLWLVKERKQKGEPFDEDWSASRRSQNANKTPASQPVTPEAVQHPVQGPTLGQGIRETLARNQKCVEDPPFEPPDGEWSDWIENITPNSTLTSNGEIMVRSPLGSDVPLHVTANYPLRWTKGGPIKIKSRSTELGIPKTVVTVSITRC